MSRAGKILDASRTLAQLLQISGAAHHRRRGAQVRPRLRPQPASAFPQHQTVHRLLRQIEVRQKEGILLPGLGGRGATQVPGQGQRSTISEHGHRKPELFARILQTFKRGALEIAQQTRIFDSRLA